MLIGVGSYDHLTNLPGVHHGAVELKAVLTDEKHGSLMRKHCVVLPERTSGKEVGRALAVAAMQAEDLLLIYFAGHGVLGPRRSDLYLALAGTDPEHPGFSGVPFESVRDAVLNSDAAAKVVILDCCYSGRALGLNQSPDISILDEVVIEGTAILTSAGPNVPSKILEGESYPAYTQRMLKLLRDGLPGGPELLTLPVLHRELRTRLIASGVRPPQANVDSLLDQLGLIANRAWTAGAPDAGQPFGPPTESLPIQHHGGGAGQMSPQPLVRKVTVARPVSPSRSARPEPIARPQQPAWQLWREIGRFRFSTTGRRLLALCQLLGGAFFGVVTGGGADDLFGPREDVLGTGANVLGSIGMYVCILPIALLVFYGIGWIVAHCGALFQASFAAVLGVCLILFLYTNFYFILLGMIAIGLGVLRGGLYLRALGVSRGRRQL